MPLSTEVDLGPVHIVLDWDPVSPPPRKGHSSPLFSARVHCGQTIAHVSYCWALVWTLLLGSTTDNAEACCWTICTLHWHIWLCKENIFEGGIYITLIQWAVWTFCMPCEFQKLEKMSVPHATGAILLLMFKCNQSIVYCASKILLSIVVTYLCQGYVTESKIRHIPSHFHEQHAFTVHSRYCCICRGDIQTNLLRH